MVIPGAADRALDRASVRGNLADGYTDADRVWEIDSPSHNLMITDPEEATEMLLRLASQ